MFKRVTQSLAFAVLTAAGMSSAVAQENDDNYRHLFMAGGALPLCSSFNKQL